MIACIGGAHDVDAQGVARNVAENLARLGALVTLVSPVPALPSLGLAARRMGRLGAGARAGVVTAGAAGTLFGLIEGGQLEDAAQRGPAAAAITVESLCAAALHLTAALLRERYARA
jgi:hypothetical protein